MNPEDAQEFESDSASLATNLMLMQEMVDDMQAIVVQRRDKLIADGFSPTAAEAMAETMWRSLWAGTSQ